MGKQSSSGLQSGGDVSRRQQTVVTNADKPFGQDVEEEAPYEFLGIQLHYLLPAIVRIVLVAETDPSVPHAEKPRVGDCDSMRVPCQVVVDMLGACKRGLGVDDPLLPVQCPFQRGEFLRAGQGRRAPLERETAFGVGLLQFCEELAAKQAGKNPDREQVVLPCRDPTFGVRRKPPAGDNAVQMRMKQQVLAPGVKHRGESDLGAQALGIGGHAKQRICRGLEEDVIDQPFVSQGERVELLRHGEHHVEVGAGEQALQARFQPLGLLGCLAFGAVAVPARIVGHAVESATGAVVEMTSQRGRTAGGQVANHRRLFRGDWMARGILRAMGAKDFRHL